MNTNRNNELWLIYMAKAKCCYSTGYAAPAAQLFHRAEEIASAFDPSDIRRGLSYSWLALCYFSVANYSIAEDMFNRAEHIYSFATDSSYRRELADNLATLGAFSRTNGALAGAQKYSKIGVGRMRNFAEKPAKRFTSTRRSVQMDSASVQRIRLHQELRNSVSSEQQEKVETADSPVKKMLNKLRNVCRGPQPVLSASGRSVLRYS